MPKQLFSLFFGILACFVFTSQARSQTVIVQKENEIHCTVNEKPLFVYRASPGSYEKLADNEYKTYMSELCTPEGRNILRDAPWDHLHHHGLMFAIAADDVNFWEEHGKDNAGVQLGHTISFSCNADTRQINNEPIRWIANGALFQKVDWYKPDKTIVINEHRTIKVARGSDLDVTLLTWTSTLSAGPGRESVKLSGSHYYGLGMRFDETMDKNGTFFCDPGSTIVTDNVRGDEKKTPCKWMAYTAELHGKPVTVAVFDTPDNPRPMNAFTMGELGQSFAYMAATVDLEKEPIILENGEPLMFRYVVAVWEGKKSTEEVEEVYQRRFAVPDAP